jgi:iron uptake system component EfeO
MTAPLSRAPRATLVALALLLPFAAACGSNDESTGKDDVPSIAAVPAGATPTSGPITVTVTDDACELSTQAAFAGANVLEVTNKAKETAEVYVYEGTRVVTEREGIKAGDEVEITFEAEAGDFQIACKPGDKDLRTGLELAESTSAGGADAAKTKAVADYRAYVQKEVDDMIPVATQFVAAVKGGDVAKAKELFAPSRVGWEAIEPVAESFGDLDPAVDLREADLEANQEWTGWHKIEKQLWVNGNTTGMGPVADELLANLKDLQGRVATAELTATGIANGAKELLDEVASGKITGEEDIFSHTDLVDFAANVKGAQEAFTVLKPIVSKSDPALTQTLTTEFANVQAVLKPYETGNGTYKSYDQVTEAERATFSKAVDALSEPLSKLAAAVA